MATLKDKSSTAIERRAINSSGTLGSLYDACRDRVIEILNKSCHEKHFPSTDLPKCKLISGNTDESNNLLRWMDIQNELRLSLLLKSTKRDGIGEVLEYPHHIDEYTRFIYYSRISREYQLHVTPKLKEITPIWNRCLTATHMITSIHIGIDVIIVLQLPSDDEIAAKVIDSILKKIYSTLSKDEQNIYQLSTDEIRMFGNIVNIKVYSNIPTLSDLREISKILPKIDTARKNATSCRPLSYTLEALTSVYPASMLKTITFKPLLSDIVNNIEQRIVQLRNEVKNLHSLWEKNQSKLLKKHHKDSPDEAEIQFLETKKQYRQEIQRYSKLVIDARSDQVNTWENYQVKHDDKQIAYEESMYELAKNQKFNIGGLSTDKVKEKVSKSLNPAEHCVNKSDNVRTTEDKSVNHKSNKRILGSNDASNKSNKPTSTDRNQRSTNKNEYNPTTYSSNVNRKALSLTKLLPTSSTVPPSSKIIDDTINILLLGETGVGKSTFINAFANYLTFNTLSQAEANEPNVIIPVSFVMTTGDNFQEHAIKFGEIDSSNNENFNNAGHSVTQHCKSYVFDLKENGRQLRIIDTPGFGDTRGLEQDDQNMEHILKYMNNLTHLNAICFLLKPNSSRLNMFFRTCLIQLSSFLAPAAQQNVIFCFTNARSTFYTPGDTAPLLKSMLAGSSFNDISFQKANTFCLDSESFRYLVALQNKITFTEENKHEYQTSWSTSVEESNRLINYIDEKLIPYYMSNGWQSIKHAQLEISYMIRPMLEAMRNHLRNIILCKQKHSTEFIELYAKSIHRATTCCLTCGKEPQTVGHFWILLDGSYEIQTDCLTCSCTPDRYVTIDYILEFQPSNNPSQYYQKQITDELKKLYEACAKFAHFLIDVAHSTSKDPFLIGFRNMIDEEEYICNRQKSALLNKQLIEALKQLEKLYEEHKNRMKLNREIKELSVVYELIKTIADCPIVQRQMVAVKQSQKNIMEKYEHEANSI